MKESLNIDLGDIVIEFENMDDKLTSLRKKSGAPREVSINQVLNNFSERLLKRFSKILPNVTETGTSAEYSIERKIIQVRIIYFPTYKYKVNPP